MPKSTRRASAPREGWKGWDEYAPFYDWENAQTLGRKDVQFWQGVAGRVEGRVLELGCGTGRVSLPLARDGVSLVGVDRSAQMLERAAKRVTLLARRSRTRHAPDLTLVRADIRSLPFGDGQFSLAIAPYGILQSLLRDRDLTSTLASVHRVLAPGALLGIDLVPDVPNWREYSNRVRMRGRAKGGVHLTLVESVRHDRRRHLTIFEQVYVRRRGRDVSEHRFDLTFRTLPIPQMVRRIERAGFAVEAVLGDYRGGPWDERADTWIILARRRAS